VAELELALVPALELVSEDIGCEQATSVSVMAVARAKPAIRRGMEAWVGFFIGAPLSVVR
jgi:hypothetical protein